MVQCGSLWEPAANRSGAGRLAEADAFTGLCGSQEPDPSLGHLGPAAQRSGRAQDVQGVGLPSTT
jgi:hypothetical protein